MRAAPADPLRLLADRAAATGEPRSPCIRHCCLDEADVCLGCGRHVDEITGWHYADDAGKREILARAAGRRAARSAR